MMLRKGLTALAVATMALGTAVAPAMAQNQDNQQAMMQGVVDKHALGLPIMQADGQFVGWLTGINMPSRSGAALIEQPPLADGNVQVLAIDASALRRSGNTLVLGSQVAAQPAEYGLEGGQLID